MGRLLLISSAVMLGTVYVAAGRAIDRPRVFTAEQAATGKLEIEKNSFGDCTSCHTRSLRGRTGDEPNEVPGLTSLPLDYQKLIQGNGGQVPAFVGPKFIARWGKRSTKDLTANFLERFGPQSGRLTEDTRLNIIAYILQANGAMPGKQPLTMSTDVEIGTLMAN